MGHTHTILAELPQLHILLSKASVTFRGLTFR